MKKMLIFLNVLVLVFSITACSGNSGNSSEGTESSTVTDDGVANTSDSTNESSSKQYESTGSGVSNDESGSTEELINNESSNESSSEHVHVWNPVYKTIHHDAEYQTIHHEAETHTVHHDAEYKTVHHDAEYQTIHHEAEYKTEKTLVNYTVQHQYATFQADGHTIDPYDYNYVSSAYKQARQDYQTYLESIGKPSNYSYGPLVSHTLSVDFYNSLSWTFDVVTPNYETHQVLVHEAYDETVLVHEAYDEQVLVKAAWDETIVDKAAWDETVLVKAAYDEQIIDHYECECGETKTP